MRQLKISKAITSRDVASLDKYLTDIGKVPLITAEDEVGLAQRIKQGDKIALEKLTMANLRFVVSVAKQYQNKGLGLSDLINQGNLGLIKAAHKFDETRGFKFISYAVWWIRQSILEGIAENARVVRIPQNKIGILNKINTAKNKLEQKLGRKPTNSEISEFTEMKLHEVDDLQRISHKITSLSYPISFDGDETLEDTISSEERFNTDTHLLDESLKTEIERALKLLSEREAKVLRLFFGLSGNKAISLEQIGEEIGCTRERARQIKEKGIRRLKHISRSKILKTYL